MPDAVEHAVAVAADGNLEVVPARWIVSGG
jgi:hypothetical protein